MTEEFEAGAPRSAIARLSDKWRARTNDKGYEVYAQWAFNKCAEELDAALRACAEALATPQLKVQRDVVMTAIRIANREKRLNLAEDSINAITQEVVDAYAAPPRAEALAQPQQALNHEGEPLHTGDDERIDLVSGIIASAEEIDGDEELTDIAASIIEDAHKLDALLLATIQRERRAEALAPHPQHVDTNQQPRCPATTIGSQIHDPARCALPVGHVGDHQVAVPPSEWQSVRIIAKQIRQAARLGTLDVGVAAEWADALEAEARAAALARSAPAETKQEVEKEKNDDHARVDGP